MAHVKLLVAAGLAALLLGLLVTMPARVAYHWFAPDELALAGIAGSAWNGSAAAADAAGLYVADLRWDFHPTALLTGKAAWLLSARPPGGSLQTEVSVGATGNVVLRDVDATLPLSLLDGIAPLAGVDGNVDARLGRVDFHDGLPTTAEGTIHISNLVLRALSRRPVGDYRAILSTEDGEIIADVEDTAGMLDLAGTALLRQDRSFILTGGVAATGDASPAIGEQLQFLGSPDADGRRPFRFEGSL